jgi:hypothetical protein
LDLSANTSLCSTTAEVSNFKFGFAKAGSLRILNLSSTGLKPEGAIALAEALPECKSIERLTLLGNDIALNPDKAAILNVGQNVLAFGQKALKAVSVAVDSAKESAEKFYQQQSSTSSNGSTPSSSAPSSSTNLLLNVAIPTGSETALAALMAVTVSMRLNNSITNLEIVDDKELKIIEGRWKGQDLDLNGQRTPLGLFRELTNICLRNAKRIVDKEKSRRKSSISSIPSHLTLNQVNIDADIARQNMFLLKDMIRNAGNFKSAGSSRNESTSTSSEQEVMEQLLGQCKTYRTKIMSYVDWEPIAMDEKTSGIFLYNVTHIDI